MEVRGFPNYLIYQDGRVFSKGKGKFLKHQINKYGYLFVGLYNDEGRKFMKVHRLVGLHYISNPDNLKEVDHINRQRNDNKLINLRWVDSSENNQNKSINKNNKLGIKNICFQKSRNKYQYKKTIRGITDLKYFNTLEEAVEYKNKNLS